MCIGQGPETHDNYLTEKSVGAVQAEADARIPKPNEAIAVLAEITMDQVKMKRKCSLAIADLKPVNLQKAITALLFLNFAEKEATLDIDQVRTRLLKHVRHARSPELIEQLYDALQTATVIE